MQKGGFKPNFFIVGAPKSGTTSLHNYLSQHPDVFMSKTKEPCFLAPDFISPNYPQTEEEYLKCFEGYNGEPRIGESTSTYLYSKLAAKRIKEYSPEAKIIIMLRNPVDLVASLHAQRLKEGNENISSLKKALEAESDRRQGKRIPLGFKYPKEYLLYREFGNYSEQLNRYFLIFKPEDIHIIIFDDFKNNTAEKYIEVCRFLNISTDFKPNMKIYNPASMPKFVKLHRIFIIIKPFLVCIDKILRILLPSKVLKKLKNLYNSIFVFNINKGRSNLDKETRIDLANYYKYEIKAIGKIIKRDLNFWCEENI